MAEGDRDVYRRAHAAQTREKEIMKDVDGWEAGRIARRHTCILMMILRLANLCTTAQDGPRARL